MTGENVLLVTVDSLRAFRFDSPASRPHFDVVERLVDRDGREVPRTFATGPTTRSSFPAMLTGRYALASKGYPSVSDRDTLASSMRDCGFETGGFTSNPFLSDIFGYEDGFDMFRDYQTVVERKAAEHFPEGIERPGNVLATVDRWIPVTATLKRAYRFVSGSTRPYTEAERLVDDTLAFVEGASDPFFCWTHLMDVHHPCFPPEEYRDQFDVDPDVSARDVSPAYSRFVSDPDELTEADLSLLERLYCAAVAYVNDQLHRVLDGLEREDLLESTTVIVTSDHGELFGEHGEYDKPPRLYDELLRVPLVVSPWPEDLMVGDGFVSLRDLPALVCHVADCDAGQRFGPSGRGEEITRDVVVAEELRDGAVLVSARTNGYRYEIDRIRGKETLYDLSDDQRSVDPASVPADTVDRLRQEVTGHLARIEATEADVEVPARVQQRLEDLGYVE